MYQGQHVKDCLIFEDPTLDKQKMSFPFWQDEVTCYELHTTMRQKDIQFVTILNKMRINKQSDKDIEYMNSHCCRRPPLDPLFPYIFYTNKDVKKIMKEC